MPINELSVRQETEGGEICLRVAFEHGPTECKGVVSISDRIGKVSMSVEDFLEFVDHVNGIAKILNPPISKDDALGECLRMAQGYLGSMIRSHTPPPPESPDAEPWRKSLEPDKE